jgi:general secretion pathway protein C
MHAAVAVPSPDFSSAGESTSGTDLVARAVRGIQRTGEGEFVVDRAFFDEMLTDPSELIGTARAVMTGGQEGGSGLRLLSLRRGSPLTLLGLRRGDVLTSINGHSLAKPAELLTAYATLARSERLELELRRGAESPKIVVEVR